MTKHTPEPWVIGYKDGSGDDYICHDNEAVAVIRWGCGCCKPDGPLTETELANMARITACVNALANRNPDALAGLESALEACITEEGAQCNGDDYKRLVRRIQAINATALNALRAFREVQP